MGEPPGLGEHGFLLRAPHRGADVEFPKWHAAWQTHWVLSVHTINGQANTFDDLSFIFSLFLSVPFFLPPLFLRF